jgi:hypothetical protein
MSLTPKIAMSDDFLRAFSAIPRDSQQAVLTFVAKFRQNPLARGINYEKINNAADSNMRSVRINDSLRGIVLKPSVGDVYCLLWVDRHDDAYQWARLHKVAIHPDVGNIQIYAVEQREEQSAREPFGATSGGGLFAELKDREIRRLGVPDDKLAAVRAVNDDAGLEELESELPDDAYEALYLFAAGEPYQNLVADREANGQVDTADFGAALDRIVTQRHFVVLTDDSDLQDLLAAPLDLWRVFLHPDQRKLVNRDWGGPVKVTGGAGTGKTVVAMHRAARLARQYANLPGRPVVFTTFTKTLAEDIRHHLEQLCSPQELEKIQVVNLDQWALSLLRRFGYKFELLYDGSKRKSAWESAMAALPASVDLSRAFLRAEYERVVLPQGCETANDYMRASRIGRGGQLGRAQRKAIWPVFAEYRAQLHANNLREPEEAFRDACILLKERGAELGIRCMIVDEAQDISPAAFALIRAATPVAQNDLFIVGDAHQRIYRHKAALNQVGIEVRGRSHSLKVNYRTTDEIRRWACAQLEGCEIDDLDGAAESLKGYKSLTHGGIPEVEISHSIGGDVSHIERILRESTGDGATDQQVCIVVRTNDELGAYAHALEQKGVRHLKLERTTVDDQSVPGVRLATMHRVKGLEFEFVIIAGYKSPETYAEGYARDEDCGAISDAITSERCLLHVAATRAKRHLFVLQRPMGDGRP